MNAISECVKGMGEPLARVLVEGYEAILESKVNQALTPLYNFCLKSGDWTQCPPGKHEVKLELATGNAIRDYVANKYPQGYEPRDAMLRKIGFSTSVNSDRRNFVNKVREIRCAYCMACDAEYELAGHDTSRMKWPGRLQKFMDAFCDGRVGWTPGEAKNEVSDVQSPYPEKDAEPAKLSGVNAGVDTTGWDSWKRFGKEKKDRH